MADRILSSLVSLFLSKNSKVQKRGKINLIGRLQLTTERMREEENEGIVQLRILRTQVTLHIERSNLRNLKFQHFFPPKDFNGALLPSTLQGFINHNNTS